MLNWVQSVLQIQTKFLISHISIRGAQKIQRLGSYFPWPGVVLSVPFIHVLCYHLVIRPMMAIQSVGAWGGVGLGLCVEKWLHTLLCLINSEACQAMSG